MRSKLVVLGAVVVWLFSLVSVYAADHPDSVHQSIADGCGRTQLGLLGEAALSTKLPDHPTAMPSWVYVDGDNRPKTVEGTVLGTHTAGTDLFGVHDTYDLNIDVKPDAAYEGLLSTRNAEENPGQIHTEWESGLAPLFAWPDAGDRVRETGSEIWDCGHWQDGSRRIPESDYVPGDPLGDAGIEKVGGEEIEIHPIAELATWRAAGNFVPAGRTTAVHASQLDVALSNQGGKAKAVENCAIPLPHQQSGVVRRFLAGSGCSRLQKIAGRDYTYELKPPVARPSSKAVLHVQQDVHFGHHAPVPVVSVKNDVVHVTVPFASVPASDGVQDFGATWHAWWTRDNTPTRRYRVTLESVTIYNNLDGDSSAGYFNPTLTPNGEWNMFVDVNGNWVNLHDPRPGHTDYVSQLGSVPSARPNPQVLSLARVPSRVVALGDRDALHLFTDARECDQPGYVDCPTNELATTGKSAGRAELSLPNARLVHHVTHVTIHPQVCAAGQPCPEEHNDPATCPRSCYAMTYRIEDITTKLPLTPVTINGDGTAGGTVYADASASGLAWWINPVTRYAPDQEEENVIVADVIDRYLHQESR
ncbi:MAG TPA: hypothetical protein VHC63_05745 [Acidimicrobiales bacterium]|nr:hypothetical protein [Acidimicrobiales bacterium]